MKPNFALGLTDDGITLWQRGSAGWLRVGAVKPDAPDMDAQMRDLLKVASALAPEGMITKLLVPDEQILFVDLQVTSRARGTQENEIRRQLHGRTPYPVEELDFDWCGEGPDVHVAVVARETLVEAEDFARSYGLNPVSAVAAPGNGRFDREPFFGLTRSVRDVLPDPALLERDTDMLHETGLAVLPEPEMSAPKKGSADSAEKPAQSKPQSTAGAKAGDDPAAPAVKPDAVADAKSATEAAKPAPADKKPDPKQPASGSQAASDRKAALLGKLSGTKSDPNPPAVPAEQRNRFSQLMSTRKSSEVDAARPEAEGPAAQGAEGEVAFRSRRNTQSAPQLPVTTTSGTALLASIRAKMGETQVLSKTAFGAFGKALKQRKDGKGKKEKPAAETKADSKPDTLKSAIAAQPSGAAAKKAAPKSDTAEPWVPPQKPALQQQSKTSRKDPLETLRDYGKAGRTQSEAERMTVFGARHKTDAEPSGLRRALLVLGGVGILLVAVAIWALYFNTTQPSSPQLSEDAPEVLVPEPLAGEMADATVDQTILEEIESALGLEDAAQQPPIDATEPDAVEEALATQPDRQASISENELTAGRAAGLRSMSLIPPQEAVPLPSAPAAPAPFGAEPLAPLREEVLAQPDAVPEDAAPVAQADGATSLPPGEDALEITVSQGTPPVVPPARPEGLAPELEAATPDPEPPALQAEPIEPLDESSLVIDVIEGQPAAVPPPRPGAIAPELVPPAQTAPDADEGSSDQASLTAPPPGGVALTALRPAARPDTLVAETPVEPEEETLVDVSQLAVAASLRPGSRPTQFSAIVQRAQRTTPTPTPAPAEPVQTARAAVSTAPSIPSSASVSREATQTRAINLRQVNLIGVMGTSSSRRALVRLSNGRVVTVRVGESLDGGQVTAIGEDELRYIRRGRDVVLRIAS